MKCIPKKFGGNQSTRQKTHSPNLCILPQSKKKQQKITKKSVSPRYPPDHLLQEVRDSTSALPPFPHSTPCCVGGERGQAGPSWWSGHRGPWPTCCSTGCACRVAAVARPGRTTPTGPRFRWVGVGGGDKWDADPWCAVHCAPCEHFANDVEIQFLFFLIFLARIFAHVLLCAFIL